MQRIFIMILLTAFLLFMLPAVAWAQGETPQVPIGDLFTWYTQDPPNYKNGILFLVLGAIGALATMYAAVGGVLPGTAGKDELDKQQRNLDVARQLGNTYQQEVEALNKKPDLTPADENRLNRYREDVKDARGRADELEVRLNREKWKQFFIACVYGARRGPAWKTPPSSTRTSPSRIPTQAYAKRSVPSRVTQPGEGLPLGSACLQCFVVPIRAEAYSATF
jgi:hypothetical protein